MKTTFAIRAGGVVAAALFVLSGGCQTFSGTMAGATPPPTAPNSSAIAGSAAPSQPITKGQKLDVEMALARAAENDGNTEQAIQLYHDVIQKDSGCVEAYHRLAIVYDMKGDVKKAHEHYMMAIQKAPKNAELYCDFGYSCYLQRNWSEAGSNLRRALELRPDFARAHTNLGLLLARTYHATEALAEFSKAGCDVAAARCNLAFALTMEDRWSEARQQYELALQANPHAPAAKKGLAALGAHEPEGDVEPTGIAAEPASVPPPPVRIAEAPSSIPPPPTSAAQVLLRIVPPEPIAPASTASAPPPTSIAPPPAVVQTSLISPATQPF